MRYCLVAVLLLAAAFSYTNAACTWDNCNAWSDDPNVITAHLVPHTHDDLGWLKTVDQYFWGTHQDPVNVGVQYIYSTVIEELLKDPVKRFSFAETGFLWRWFTSYSQADQQNLIKLIQNGQIEMIGGGWVQNDEAAAHYVDVIDQMTVGLKHLSDTFGECGKPLAGWQIDPFGHSREMANIYRLMGYESLWFARLHFLEKQDRVKNKTLETLWNASDDLKTQILTGAFFQSDYNPPSGYCWDRRCGDEPIKDNPDLEEYNVDQMVRDFVADAKKQAASLRSNHTLYLMGSDFHYTNANMFYLNMDKLIKYVNADPSNGVKVIYSTPACYTKAFISGQPQLTEKNDDFFPYASSTHAYWTGYFTSRPAFKGQIREASALLQLGKQLNAQANLDNDKAVQYAREASALCQHHDSVTGTAKEAVTQDYRLQLDKGTTQIQTVINDFAAARFPQSSANTAPSQALCKRANETVCDVTSNVPTFAATVFNSRGQPLNQKIRIPLYSQQATVYDATGAKIPSQIVPSVSNGQISTANRASYEVIFNANVSPLGYSTYIVDNSTTASAAHADKPAVLASGPVTIANEFLSLKFDASGFLSSVTDLTTGVTTAFRQEFFYYEGVDDKDSQPSGAYIFRPKSTYPKTFATVLDITVVNGSLVQEVRQTISPYVSQIVRLYAGANYIEFDWTVGPIPKEATNPSTKEVITRYTTDIQSVSSFYTDSNGRQMMPRKTNYNPSFTYADDEPVAGNYYPITNRIFIKDSKTQFTVLTDRAEGGSSLRDGVVEIMLHRRCFYDDHYGVGEALDEPGDDGRGLVVRGTHTVHIGDVTKAASVHRPLAANVFAKPFVSYAPATSISDYQSKFNMQSSGLKQPLPDGVNLLTLEKWTDTTLLLRLENLYEGFENSAAINVDISNLFADFTVTGATELMLGANRQASTSVDQLRAARRVDAALSFTLGPQQIRTFELTVTRP